MRKYDWIAGQIDTEQVGPNDMVDLLNEMSGGAVGTIRPLPAKEALAAVYTHWRKAVPRQPTAGEPGYMPWLVGELLLVRTDITLQAATLIREYASWLERSAELVRELDVALCGDSGAAKQASLVDIVAMVKDKRIRVLSDAQIRAFVDDIVSGIPDGSIAIALAKALATP